MSLLYHGLRNHVNRQSSEFTTSFCKFACFHASDLTICARWRQTKTPHRWAWRWTIAAIRAILCLVAPPVTHITFGTTAAQSPAKRRTLALWNSGLATVSFQSARAYRYMALPWTTQKRHQLRWRFDFTSSPTSPTPEPVPTLSPARHAGPPTQSAPAWLPAPGC